VGKFCLYFVAAQSRFLALLTVLEIDDFTRRKPRYAAFVGSGKEIEE